MEMARGANKAARRKRGALRDGGTGWLVCFSKFLTFVYLSCGHGVGRRGVGGGV